MELVTREAPRAPAGTARLHAEGGAMRGGLRAHLANLGQLLASHAVVAVAGIASLPLLARNLGAEPYGRFSLFVLTLGLLSNLDVARPILVRQFSREGDTASDPKGAAALTATSAWALAAASALLGLLIGGPLVAVALAVAVFLHVLAAVPFAALSARGRVGTVGSIRNVCWASAIGVVVLLSFVTTTAHAWVWPFAVANGAILLLSLRAAPGLGVRPWPPSPVAFLRYRVQATDVLVFAVASAVVSSCDRFLLDATADGATFGRYAAQYDLAIKINIVSTALGTILYPSFSRAFAREDALAAAKRFVGIASKVAALYFALLLTLVLLHAPVARLVLGAELGGPGTTIYPILLVGVFVHLFGFLVTAYQRAHGDFRSHRRSYVAAAVLMLGVGALAIPRFGVAGAVGTYLTARLAEVTLVVGEVRRMPAGAVRRGHLVALVAMVAVLAGAAALAATGHLDLELPAALVGAPATEGGTR